MQCRGKKLLGGSSIVVFVQEDSLHWGGEDLGILMKQKDEDESTSYAKNTWGIPALNVAQSGKCVVRTWFIAMLIGQEILNNRENFNTQRRKRQTWFLSSWEATSRPGQVADATTRSGLLEGWASIEECRFGTYKGRLMYPPDICELTTV
jgi:hypothetical protein